MPSQPRPGLSPATLIAVPLVLLLGQISARVGRSGESNPWFASLVKPALYPPGIVFGVVWTILYVMMAIAVAIVWQARNHPRRGGALGLFILQLLLNLAWSPLFFRFHQIGAAFVLIVAIFVAASATALLFASIRRLAGWLFLPYLAWLIFAAMLNWGIWDLNPAGDQGRLSASAQ